MDRRAMIGALAATAIVTPLAAFAQAQAKVRVGWLAVGPIPSNITAFRQAMQQRGYVEGQNLILEERYASTNDQYSQSIAALIGLKVDLLVTTGGVASHAAKSATTKVPIVFLTTDPVGSGLVSSLARPTENLTGVAIITQDFNAKRVETIVSMVPGMRKVAALNDLSGALNPNIQRAFWAESEAAALRFGIRVEPKTDLRNIDDVDEAFAAASKAGAGAMLTISSSYFNAHEKRLVNAAAKARLPTIYEHRDFVEAGGLVSYGPDLRAAYALAATYVDKILKGTKPADLPVQQVDKVELVINQRTARTLKLAIPQALLLRADEVIQ
jgi:putative tryptophan/tyrosine transport system substrate-binding protein